MQRSRRTARAVAVVMAIALLVAGLPRLAATLVRAEIATESAADRAAFASGRSPWAWRFHHPDDVVAGRAFGDATLQAVDGGLSVTATSGAAFELGLPLRHDADLARLDTLRIEANASAPGRYMLSARQTLSGPVVHAEIGTWPSGRIDAAIRVDHLAWLDDGQRVVPPPTRAAMLRLGITLPAGQSLILSGARLSLAEGVALPPSWAIPTDLTAERLLAWRDRQRDLDPLAGFVGAAPIVAALPVDRPVSAWKPWLAPGLYALVILIALLARRVWRTPASTHRLSVDEASSLRRQASGASRPHRFPVLDVALVLFGPLWFIVTLGLSPRPAPSGVAMFAIGVVHALFLAARHRLPRWHWLGARRAAAWPLSAVIVALAIAVVAGHAPVWPSPGRVLLYLGWAFFQQWLMLAVVAALLVRALPPAGAVVLTALAFALLHSPNGVLMQMCFVAELGWAWWYLRHRALLPVALAHAVSAVILQACVTGGILRSLEVSARFLN